MALINLCPCLSLARHATIVCFYCLCIPSFRCLRCGEKVKICSEDSVSSLQACFECTDWHYFFNVCEDFDELCDNASTSILHEQVYYNKEGFIYPHNKPRITKDLKWSSTKGNRLFTQVIFLRRRLSY